MHQLEGFVQGINLVCKLKKSLYRLVQSVHTWHEIYNSELHKLDYKAAVCDLAFFVQKSVNGELTMESESAHPLQNGMLSGLHSKLLSK